ncbi:hypothetical protein ACOMHN_042063 [Nucella lapillus]
MAIGYLPLAVLAMNFDQLVQDFIEYFRRTYIGPRATFPPVMWCVSDRDMDQRTNNHAEAFHKTFASAVAVRRHNIWVFLRVLKDQQALSENTFEAVRRGELPPKRRKKWRNLEEAPVQHRSKKP